MQEDFNNKIVRSPHDEIQTSLDEIFGFQPQMKLNPSIYPDKVGFHLQSRFHQSKIDLFRLKDGFR